jgi:hypothetical protein
LKVALESRHDRHGERRGNIVQALPNSVAGYLVGRAKISSVRVDGHGWRERVDGRSVVVQDPHASPFVEFETSRTPVDQDRETKVD